MTKGRRLLRAAVARVGVRKLAGLLGCAPSTVSRWWHGDRVPGGAWRWRLERHLPGCTPASWEELADDDGTRLPAGNTSPATTEEHREPGAAA